MPETIEELKKELAKYKENGPAKLYYALLRKSWEMADLLNKNNMSGVELEDKDNKQFDRIQKLMLDSTKVAEACKTLEGIAGITGNEEADVKKLKPISPQSIARGDV